MIKLPDFFGITSARMAGDKTQQTVIPAAGWGTFSVKPPDKIPGAAHHAPT
jgi:hypothetical protein